LAHNGACARDKRKRGGAAGLACQERSTGAEARECRGVQIGVVRTVCSVRRGLTNCDGSGVGRRGIHILAARDARGVGPLDEVWRGTCRTDEGCRRAYGGGLDSKWKSTSGVALVNGSVQQVNSGRAGLDAGLASGRGHERSRGRAADGPRDDVSTGGETGVGSCVQILLVVAVRGVHIALANSDCRTKGRSGVDVDAARHAGGV